jgi:hypothetical protein
VTFVVFGISGSSWITYLKSLFSGLFVTTIPADQLAKAPEFTGFISQERSGQFCGNISFASYHGSKLLNVLQELEYYEYVHK